MWESKDLNLDEKIGQLFVFGFTDPEEAIRLIKRYKFGNIIYFRRNLGTGENMAKLSKSIQQAMMNHIGIPAIISSDQEGGMINRFSSDATFFPGAMATSATGNVEMAYELGRRIAEELLCYGINLNLAPVLDINSNPKNPVIGVRSFSDDKETVKDFGLAMMHGMQDAGVMACGKHFPGHGDTHMDSHISLPSIGHSLNRIEDETYPFRHAIREGIASIMSAHLLLPALEDQKIPATMSQKILTGLLKEKLGFKGLIITDCLEMDAIAKYYGVAEGALMAVKAGADLLCVSHTAERQIETFERIKQAVLDGEVAMVDLERKVQRILDYKKQYRLLEGVNNIRVVPDTMLESNRSFAKTLARRSITLVRDQDNLLPIAKGEKIMAVSPIRKVFSGIDGTLSSCDFAAMVAKRLGCEYASFEQVKDLSETEIEAILKKCAAADKVIIGSYNATIVEKQQELMKRITEVNPHVIIVALRIPYDVSILQDVISTAVCTYEYTEEAIHELIDGMMGNFKLTGKLPVQI